MGNGVILDTNCFSHVFNAHDIRHPEFEYFLNWLCRGPGYLVYGGSKYLKELEDAKKYLRFFTLLQQYNKARVYDKSQIDLEMDRIKELIKDADFDDPHLAAIVIITKARVICTGDERCIRHLKQKHIYNGKVEVPRFYINPRCSSLLTERYVGHGLKLNKRKAELLSSMISQASSK